MRDFTEEAQRITAGLNNAVRTDLRDKMLLDLSEASASNRDEILNIVDESCILAVKNAGFSEEDIIAAKDRKTIPAMTTLNASAVDIAAGLSAKYADLIRKTCDDMNRTYGGQIEKKLSQARDEISAVFERDKSRVDNPTAMSLINEFSIPDFPPSFSLDLTSGSFDGATIDEAFLKTASEDAHSKVTETKTRTDRRRVKREAEGIWENICAFFGTEYYELRDFEVPYEDTRDVYDVEKFRMIIVSALEKRVRKSVASVMREVNKAAEHDAEKIFADIMRQCQEISAQYMENFRNLSNDIQMTIDSRNRHRESLLNDIAALNGISEDFRPFFAMWDEVKTGREEE